MEHAVTRPTRIALLVLFVFMASMAYADEIKRSIPVKPGQTLTVETDMGAIEIEGDSADTVEVEVIREGRGSEKLEVSIEPTADGVSVVGDWTGGKTGWASGNNPKIRYRIKVPATFNLELDTSGGSISIDDLDGQVRARTSGGSVRLGRIEGEVVARTSGGSIQIKGGGADIQARTSGGSINIGDVSGSVEAKTSGGSINIDEASGTIVATTGGGSVTARMATQPQGRSKLSTSGGGVTLYVNPTLNLNINASARGGGVRSELPINGKTRDDRSLRGPLNEGGPEVELSTSGGGVRIKSL